jgi:hypothetical protein
LIDLATPSSVRLQRCPSLAHSPDRGYPDRHQPTLDAVAPRQELETHLDTIIERKSA